jgi:hypothetical protein
MGNKSEKINFIFALIGCENLNAVDLVKLRPR